MEANLEERQEPQRDQEMHVNTRDRLFHAIFLKVGLVYARTVPKPVRTGVEILLITKAIILFTILSYVHFTFSKQPMNCLESIQNDWPRDGVLRVQVLLDQNPSSTESMSKYFAFNSSESIEEYKHKIEMGYSSKNISSVLKYHQKSLRKRSTSSNYLQSFFELVAESNKVSQKETVVDSLQGLKGMKKVIRGYQSVKERYIMEFALEYGFLRLSPLTRQKLKIPIKVVTLDPVNDKCFGDSVSKFLLNHFLGYDDVLIASIKRLAEMEDNRGFMRNVVTGEHYRFVSVWMSRSSYILAFLLMFVFTISVATLLRFCHQQIFFFMVHLLQILDWNIAVAFPVAPLFTVILSLVGMEVIMSEFFNDTSTSFYIILIVWAADQFDSICCHTTISQKFWLRFFYLYHFVFYAYHYRFNGQYSSIALASSWFFIQHSMLYFLHNYELPAIENQLERGAIAGEGTQGIADTVADVGDAFELLYNDYWPVLVNHAQGRVGANMNNEPTNHGRPVQHVLAHVGVASPEETNDVSLQQRTEISSDTVAEESLQTVDPNSECIIVENSYNSSTVNQDESEHSRERTFEFLPSGGTFLFGHNCVQCDSDSSRILCTSQSAENTHTSTLSEKECCSEEEFGTAKQIVVAPKNDELQVDHTSNQDSYSDMIHGDLPEEYPYHPR